MANSHLYPPGFVRDYDAHVYFTAETRASAAELHAKALKDFAGLPIFVGRLIDRPVGPHPLPMFELDFGREYFESMLKWMKENRGRHTVLIHTVTGDDVHDHFEGATWLGDPLPLDLSKLDPSPTKG